MPSSAAVFAAVASAVGGVDRKDREAVAAFFRRLLEMPQAARELIADFVIGHERRPRAADLAALREKVRAELEQPAAPKRLRAKTAGPRRKSGRAGVS